MKIQINKSYEKALNSQKRYEILYGGAGAGKSYFAAQKLVLRLLSETPHKILILRKVSRTNRFSTFALVKEIASEIEGVKINNSDLTIQFPNGNEVIFLGLDDTEKLKSIHGITSIWIEEATELTEEDFMQVDLRLRGKTQHYKQIILTFNPISALHWIKKRFFDTVDKDADIFKFTYKDNAFIDKEYIEVLEGLKETNENLYRVYALGEWGTLAELIYQNWKVQEFPQPSELIAGIDFGFNNPNAVVYLSVDYDARKIFVWDELYVSKITNKELIELLKQKPQAQIYYPDTAEPDRIEELYDAGFIVGKTNKDVTQGINFVKNFTIIIHPQCTNFIKEIETYSYQKDKNGQVLEIPVKFNDHLMDAMRYAVYSHAKQGNVEILVL
ncbi:PBSX family phage terminase large subunit [Caldisericum sp.]|uniref:PBSX family phage terminase large subunit n=1 Tax=Caldisericum sp. TaxID=2499687 RepID=UPI003D0BC249